MLPPPLLTLLLALPALSLASPSPALVSDDYLHLMPRNTLFFRQTANLQSFTNALGGFAASPITNSGDAKRPFRVDGDTFTDFASAAQRSCDNQFQKCSQNANSQGNKGDLTVGDCDGQKNECNSAQQNAPVTDFQSGAVASQIIPDPDFPDFDLICDT
ncbi:hypothetical protein K458DRAFT_398569 [Lentithecium fluviatile CBS 122367]|uniref:Uncharacterized protein n=1 Tax=Lentithecium fluviatile CBS 122367 TaxID=1168545 RepID=A0A6G1JP51_9PLEO|nr:hypothetical protein K458DRAFT_398569 [Lentithecium fluviatile CBS 122367]